MPPDPPASEPTAVGSRAADVATDRAHGIRRRRCGSTPRSPPDPLAVSKALFYGRARSSSGMSIAAAGNSHSVDGLIRCSAWLMASRHPFSGSAECAPVAPTGVSKRILHGARRCLSPERRKASRWIRPWTFGSVGQCHRRRAENGHPRTSMPRWSVQFPPLVGVPGQTEFERRSEQSRARSTVV